MPLVAHFDLPTFSRLREQGHEVLSLEKAVRQDIRELHIGFLNMMPDTALEATERQFIRLVGNSNRIAQFYVHPFSLPGLSRGAEALAYIERYYARFEELKVAGLDALIITGANVANPKLDQEPFWDPLVDVIKWAEDHVSSILCSCLATHALLKFLHGIERNPLPAKRWGVYSHHIQHPEHPMLRDINTRFDAPHSRFNDISQEQLESSGLTVLAAGPNGGVHMAASPDGIRTLYFQGHPEYDRNSLFKEFKREVLRFHAGEIAAQPPFPENYFTPEAADLVNEYVMALRSDPGSAVALESSIESQLENTWGDTAKALFNNWLGLVYRITNLDRTRQYMPGVDPSDPLGLRV